MWARWIAYDWLLLEIGSTASAVSYPLGMWGSWSGYGLMDRIHFVHDLLLGKNAKIQSIGDIKINRLVDEPHFRK